MRQIASEYEYYENLLKAKSFSRDDLFKRDIIWSRSQGRVSGQLSKCLLQPLSSEEILKGAKAFEKDIEPGLDELGVQWYIQYWDVIGEELIKA